MPWPTNQPSREIKRGIDQLMFRLTSFIGVHFARYTNRFDIDLDFYLIILFIINLL